MENIQKFLVSPQFWTSVVIVLLCVLFWFLMSRFSKKIIKKRKMSGKNATSAKTLFSIIKYVVMLFALLTVLQVNGINVSSMITGLGIAGVVVGFALQDILKDFIMGTNILWDSFYSVGDVVKYKEIEGKVISFNLKVTKIADIKTGNIFSVCNRNVSEIEKLSDWVILKIPVDYSEEKAKVEKVLLNSCKKIEKEEDVTLCEFKGLCELSQSSVEYMLNVHCNPEKRYAVRRVALGVIFDDLCENNIKIPYNQLDVHLEK